MRAKIHWTAFLFVVQAGLVIQLQSSPGVAGRFGGPGKGGFLRAQQTV